MGAEGTAGVVYHCLELPEYSGNETQIDLELAFTAFKLSGQSIALLPEIGQLLPSPPPLRLGNF